METSHFILLALLILAVLLHSNLAVSLSTKSTTNFSTDQLALLALKSHVNSHLLETNWSSSTSVCNWIGVTCGSHQHQRVTALDLSNMNLSGILPPQIGNLSFLSILGIVNNRFHGEIPIQLANLHRLKSIGFSNNNFDGEIPSWFGSFTRLRSLFLDNNNFVGEIPSSLCSLSKLQLLSLYNNNLQGEIPVEIGNLSSLRWLYLDNNKLSGSIPSSIFTISSIQQIFLYNNQLVGSIPSIPLNTSPASSLETIDLSFNNLTGHISSDFFGHLPKLKVLNLGWNMLSGNIAMGLFKCRELGRISLSSNYLEGTIPEEIGNLTMLKELYLGANNLKGEIPPQIGTLLNLEKLSLHNCDLTGSIPSVIGNLTLLELLDLSHNKLTGKIPLQMGNLPKLEALILGNNSIYGVIPPRIFNSSTLKFIELSLNQLSGYLPSSICFWHSKLEILQFGGNKISGPIPLSISNASRLTLLTLEMNSFSGFIPFDIGKLRNLRVLSLDDNNLASMPSSTELSFLSSLANCKHLRVLSFDQNPLISGKIPISIGNLSVQEFSASGCNIKGSIPEELGSLKNLISLDLDNNELIGSIPSSIGRLGKLQHLSLQGNKLEGSIPIELCHLSNMGFLYLTGNNLVGPIPTCLGDLTSLRTLFLNQNNFTGSIPSALTRLVDILKLNLSSNFLSGALPIDIGNWKVITDIDFSKNQLSGETPKTIGDLEDLIYLSLSGNKLQGSIPNSFGGLIGLQFLDLSSNNFTGIIPKYLEKLLYLKYFNVSFNSLEGEIPNGAPFANYSIQSFEGNKALCAAPQLQLPLPPCKANSFKLHSKRAIKLVGYMLWPLGSIMLVMALILICFQRRRRNNNSPTDQEYLLELAEWRRVSYQELRQATDGFSESNLLGVGSFGSVYQATLSDGLSIAVKVFNLDLQGAFKSFDIECEVMRNIRHRNLLKIISSCCNIDFKALVLEYMPNGSLEKWLHSHDHFLDILQRLNIMVDVASALEYLHHGYSTPVVHCDLKPSNVLLDDDMVAHLSDFGIAKLLGGEDSTIHTMTLATIGYMASEYGSEGIVSVKGDIYSFGILLMETFTGKKPIDEMFIGEMSLKQWVAEYISSTSIQVVDINLLSNGQSGHVARKDCALSILQLALECSKELPEERIDMKPVVSKLKMIKINLLKDLNMHT